MKYAAIVVGHNHWHGDTFGDKRFTRDFIFALKDRNPNLDILLIDNCSAKSYATDIGGRVETLRLESRVGYAVALNYGLSALKMRDHDWYICFNNDNWIDPNPRAVVDHGRIEGILEELDPRIVYGSGWNIDKRRSTRLQWSAWLCISREVLRTVGYFDEQLAAAFEDFDYQKRALEAGFDLDTADFPIVHLDEHTRLENPDEYKWRWEEARQYFEQKHGVKTEPWLIVKGKRNA